jgi:hypothetical protein
MRSISRSSFELGDGRQDIHGEASGDTGEAGAIKLQAMHVDAERCQTIDSRHHVR